MRGILMSAKIAVAKGCLPGVGPYRATALRFPRLSLEQAAQLAHQRTVPYQLRQRATRVLLLPQQPLAAHIEAAAPVQLHLRSVQRWRRRWARL